MTTKDISKDFYTRLVKLITPCTKCGFDDQARATEACELVDELLQDQLDEVEAEMVKRVKGKDHHEYLDYLAEILDQLKQKLEGGDEHE